MLPAFPVFHIHYYAKCKNRIGLLHVGAFVSTVLVGRAVHPYGNMHTLLTAGGWDIQTAVPGTLVSPPPPQAIERHKDTAAKAAVPEALQRPEHEPAAGRPDVQQPAFGQPMIMWQPMLPVATQLRRALAVAAVPETGDLVLFQFLTPAALPYSLHGRPCHTACADAKAACK